MDCQVWNSWLLLRSRLVSLCCHRMQTLMAEPKKRGAVIYCRVSTEEQANINHSLPNQRKKCEEFCEREGIGVLKVFSDAASGRNAENRPQFLAALRFCNQNKKTVRFFVVSEVSRLARSVHTQAATLEELEKLSIGLRSVDEPHLDQTPVGRLMATMQAGYNQYFSDALSARTKERMRAAVLAGRFPWKAPLGYVNKKNGASNLSIDSRRAPLLRRLFELVAAGHSPDSALGAVTALGLRTDSGRVIPKQTLSRILRNEIYAGWIVSRPKDKKTADDILKAKGTHEPIVSQQLFDAVQDELSGKRNVPHKQVNEDFPLRKFVKCSKCHKPLTAGWAGGRSKKYATYWCWTPRCRGVCVRKEVLEDLFYKLLQSMQPSVELLAALPDILRSYHEAELERIADDRKRLNARKLEADTLNRRALRMRVSGELTAEQFAMLEADAKEDAARIQIALEALEMDTSVLTSLMEQERLEVFNIAETWAKSGLVQKQQWQNIVFPDRLEYGPSWGFFVPGNSLILQDLKEFCDSLSLVGVPDGI